MRISDRNGVSTTWHAITIRPLEGISSRTLLVFMVASTRTARADRPAMATDPWGLMLCGDWKWMAFD